MNRACKDSRCCDQPICLEQYPINCYFLFTPPAVAMSASLGMIEDMRVSSEIHK